MADKGTVIVRTRKFMRNSLLSRRQMIVDVIHPNRANVPRAELQEILGKQYKVSDSQAVVLFSFKTAFGGGKSTGFCLIYDSVDELKKFEPKYRQARAGILPQKDTSRKQIKEAKNRKKKIRGTGRSIAHHKAKKAARAS